MEKQNDQTYVSTYYGCKEKILHIHGNFKGSGEAAALMLSKFTENVFIKFVERVFFSSPEIPFLSIYQHIMMIDIQLTNLRLFWFKLCLAIRSAVIEFYDALCLALLPLRFANVKLG